MNLTTEACGHGRSLGSQATNLRNIPAYLTLATLIAILVVIIILGGSA